MYFLLLTDLNRIFLINVLQKTALRCGSDVPFTTDCSKAMVLMYFLLLNVLRRWSSCTFYY